MLKFFKLLLGVTLPLLGLTFVSCGKDDENELENSNNQTTVSEEILINSSKSLKLYEDEQFYYFFGPSGLGVTLVSLKKDENNEFKPFSEPIDGKYLCGIKKYEHQGNNFESFSTKLTDYKSKPVTFIDGVNRGDIYITYVRTAKGDYRHYKIKVNDPCFDRASNGLLTKVKYMYVVYMSY